MKWIFFIALTLIGTVAIVNVGQSSNLVKQSVDKLSVVELFTSQSCSSCPPADRVLESVSDDPNVIALGFHVTYWDHLHWKDTVSREFSTQRQRNYARSSGTRRVYTPQMIVNGNALAHFNGGNSGKLSRTLNQSPALERIEITKNADTLTLNLPKIEKADYTLWIFGTQNEFTQPIGSGENTGRTVTYRHAVLTQDKGPIWDGSKKSISLAAPEDSAVEDVIVVAQQGDYGVMRAAGRKVIK